jgi:glycosyltransferase involved in cell wall biosynthesis
MTNLTVIILTKNEACHIGRAIASVRSVATDILVVDSGSTDDTAAKAQSAGARVMHHPWTNYATQFNWALDQIQGHTGWVLRLDADEVITPELRAEIRAGLPDVAGLTVGRRICFMGQTVRHGGIFPIRVVRLFRNGLGRCETRWMDEHVIVDGPLAALGGEIVDDNRNSLDWWTAKHNSYASREVVDIMNHEYGFVPQDRLLANDTGRQAAMKRWIKEHVYARLPLGLRAGVYFFHRYFVRGGILDGPQARAFHVLQGFWYRYLVDIKLSEVRRHMVETGKDPVTAIKDILNIDVLNVAQSQTERRALRQRQQAATVAALVSQPQHSYRTATYRSTWSADRKSAPQISHYQADPQNHLARGSDVTSL